MRHRSFGPARQPQDGENDERPSEVELFFDAERPQMEQQRRASHRLEIAVVVEQQLPVGDKAKCRRDIRPQERYSVPCKKTGEQRHAENDGDEPGYQPAGPP